MLHYLKCVLLVYLLADVAVDAWLWNGFWIRLPLPIPSPAPALQACGDPDLGCVNGVSIETCVNNMCNATVQQRLTQCFMTRCSDQGRIPLCSCRNFVLATTPTTTPTTTTTPRLPLCGDPDLGCVNGASQERCVNNTCNTDVPGKLTQCFLQPCSDPTSIPRCSCPNSGPATTTDPTTTGPTTTGPTTQATTVLPCGDPDMGCVNGVSIEPCTDGVCDTEVGDDRLTQCFFEECSDPDPIMMCSCPRKPPPRGNSKRNKYFG